MNTKGNKRYKISSEKIETAFLSLISNHKYEDITISQICEFADINRSTFYCHYDDINDLVLKIETKFTKGIINIFQNGERYTHDAFVDMFTFIKDNKYFYKAFFSLPYQTSAEFAGRLQILENIGNTTDISKGKNKAELYELYYRANFFGAGIKEMCRLWLENDCKESPEDMAKIIGKEYANRNPVLV